MKQKVWSGLVRNADENDLEILSCLLHKYRIFHGGKGQVEDARRFLLERIRNNQSYLFLAVDSEERALGYAQVYPSYSSVSLVQVFILNDMFVESNSRGLGVGSALLVAVENYAKKCGVSKLRLSTTVDNHSAQRVYEKNGWKRSDEYYFYEYDVQ